MIVKVSQVDNKIIIVLYNIILMVVTVKDYMLPGMKTGELGNY